MFSDAYIKAEADRSRQENLLRDLIAKLEAMKIAAQLAPQDVIDPRAEVAKAKADPFLPAARRNPRRFAASIEDCEDEIEQAQVAFEECRDRYVAARIAEADRIAAQFQPRQVVAVGRIASALEALTKALAEEEQVHTDFLAVSPQPSALLPTCGTPFRTCRLDLPQSTASGWAARIRNMGILR